MDVHVYDQCNIGQLRASDKSQRVVLSAGTILALQAVGLNVRSAKFKEFFFYSSEYRCMDCRTPLPQAAGLPGCQIYTTYEHLQTFLVTAIQPLFPDSITLHSQHTLQEGKVDVEAKRITFATPKGEVTTEYNLLVGADGFRSNVRLAMVKGDPKMRSSISFVAPMHYTTVHGLHADTPGWGSVEARRLLNPPLDDFRLTPNIDTAARPVQLPTPVEYQGWPLYGWAGAQYHKIRLLVWQDPHKPDTFAATLTGSDHLFEALEDALDEGGESNVAMVLEGLFNKQLPPAWIEALSAALAREPKGNVGIGTLMATRLASPDAVPAIALVGDAGHATSARMGLGMQVCLDTAIALAKCLEAAPNLRQALLDFNAERQPATSALAAMDRVSPAFFGEEARMGPLALIIQIAIASRLWLNKLLTAVNLSQYAPFPSYLQALEAGVKYEDVWKKVTRDAALVTGVMFSAVFAVLRVLWAWYQDNLYLFN